MASVAKKKIADDSYYAQHQGDVLNQEAKDRAAQNAQYGAHYRNYADEVYDPLISGQGGYSANDAEGIMREGETRSSMATDQNLNDLQFNQDERDAVTGDPTKYFDPNAMQQRQDQSAAQQRAAVSGMRGDLYGAIDENGLTADTTGIELTPEEEQRMVTSAGQTAGVGYRAAVGDAEQKALAAGIDPLGVAALRGRNERASAIDSSNAMTRARIAASQSRADRKVQSEDLRLSGARDISGRKMEAATTTGQAGVNVEGNINAQQRQQQQYNTTTGTGIENTTANRALELSKNRQTTAATNIDRKFTQGLTVANTLSDRAKTIGDAKLATQKEARGYLSGQADTQNSNEQKEYDRQAGLYGQQVQARQGTTQQQIQKEAQPGMLEKIAGTAVGAVSALGGGAGLSKLAGGGAHGMVITEPTTLTAGENGPEALVPLSDDPQATTHPGDFYGMETMHKKRRPMPGADYYGMAA